MGQRLNIEILQNGNTLANAYYHWSGYTSSALELTQTIIENVDEIQHKDDVVRAIRLLETTGALLTEDEIKQMKYDGKLFRSAKSRNAGLIAISEKGMNETRRWEEARVEINLDEETVSFDAIHLIDKETYLYWYGKADEDYEKLPIKSYDYDFENISFSEFNQFASEILEDIRNENYAVRLLNGDVLGFIE